MVNPAPFLTDLDTITLHLSPPCICFLNFQSSVKCRRLHLVSLLLGVKILHCKLIKYISSQIIKHLCLEIILHTESSKSH